jgi:hypothetical protein
MENSQYYLTVLEELKKKSEEIEAQWSGEENGKQEERAHIANEICDKCVEMINLINELNN